jgi:hypothetical protein
VSTRTPSRLVKSSDAQRQMILSLVLGGLFFAAITVAAAYLYMFPPGIMNPRAAALVLHDFMLAGVRNDVTGGNVSFSADAIRRNSSAQVTQLFARRELFEDYTGLSVEAFAPVESPAGSRATVAALTVYSLEPAAGSIRAELVEENGAWRIESIDILRE